MTTDKKVSISEALELAMGYQVKGKIQQAVNICEGILRHHPDNFDALHMLGVLAYQCRKDQLAVELISKAIEYHSNFPDAYSNLAAAQMNLGNLDDAEKACKKALELNDKHIGSMANLGNIYKKKGEFALAEKHYTKVLKLASGHVATLANMSAIMNIKGNFKQAQEYAEKAVNKESNHFLARFNLGVAKENQSDYEGALESYKLAIAANPKYLPAVNNMARIFIQINRLEDAKALLDFAMTVSEEDITTLLNLGAFYIKNGENEEAFKQYEKVVGLNAINELALDNMANLRVKSGDLEGALAIYSQLETNISNPSVTSLLSMIKFAMLTQDFAKVVSLAEVALKNKGGTTWEVIDIYINNAIAHLLLNDRKRAKAIIDDVKAEYLKMKDLSANDVGFGYHESKALNAYYRYLEQMFSEKSKEVELNTTNEGELVYMIGDSHSLVAQNKVFDGKPIQSSLIWGAKVWHLVMDSENQMNAALESALNSVPAGSRVIFGFGEIDCRSDEGIYTYSKKSKKKIDDIIKDMLTKYIEKIKGYAVTYNIKPVLYGVPLVPNSIKGLDTESVAEFKNMIELYNAELQQMSAASEMEFIDIFSLTKEKTVEDLDKMFLDGCHLKGSVLQGAFEQSS